MSWLRTDLAVEASRASGEIEGVTLTQTKQNNSTISKVEVLTEEGARRLGKPRGLYITIENEGLTEAGADCSEEIARELSTLLEGLEGDVLVAGLGNRALTPDSLGPRVASRVLVTRHIRALLPDDLSRRMRAVCALTPGVTGVTGVETGELLRAAVEAVKPCCVLLIDALAAREVPRLLKTVQLTDAGVTPGSGVGNRRKDLSRASLGVPVLTLGVPMVVFTQTILRDALSFLMGEKAEAAREKALDRVSRRFGDLVVTPADVDEAVDRVAGQVALGINRALQSRLSVEEIRDLM